MIASLTFKDDIAAQVQRRLQGALRATVERTGRSGKEATKRAVIHMAKSAAAETPQAPKTRLVYKNIRFVHLLTDAQYKIQRAKGADMSRYFKFTALKWTQQAYPNKIKPLFANERKDIARISRAGLAKSSWAWGLKKLGSAAAAKQREIPGVTTASEIVQGNIEGGGVVGHEMTNKLSYIQKILEPGWELRVADNAAKKVLYLAARDIERKGVREMERGFARAA